MTANSNDSESKNSLEIRHQTISGGRQQFADTIINFFDQPKAESIPEVDTGHLPQPTTALIGRKSKLTKLTEAFTNPSIRLAILVAAGGIGKSALTDEWLQLIAEHNYYGKTHVFGWSFYSQGSHTTFTNSQPFFSAVLPFLEVTEIPKNEIEKARLLARCLQQKPCLLILDGLEPLQYSENLQTMSGELQDSALKEFIACFRRTAGNSFVLLSSRQPLVELKKWHSEHYLSLPLKSLPHDDGASLLQALGVTGNKAERKAISKDLNGHALSLVLMGHLLSEHHQGDFRYARELPPLTSAHGDNDAEKDSRHALRVLHYYDSLQDTASRSFLQLLGLFDRPMDRSEKTILIEQAQHAEPLRTLTAKQWQAVEQRLKKNGLLLGKKGSFKRLEWDTHPIIRNYFGSTFRKNHPEAFRQAHLVLFEYYQKLPEREFPDTVEKMEPLYRAVVHGCLAGDYQQAYDVYIKRISRENEIYNFLRLGAYSPAITMLASFFPFGWTEVVKMDFPEENQAELLGAASFCLMSLGRLQEAIELRLADLKLRDKLADWKEASITARNLVVLYIVTGQLDNASNIAQKALKYSQRDEDNFGQMASWSYIATISHRRGDLCIALNQFDQAELLYKAEGKLYLSLGAGFYYCALLLDSHNSNNATLQTIQSRVEYSLEIALEKNYLIIKALDYLNLARINIALTNIEDSKKYFKLALQEIQNANKVEFAPMFYLYHADFNLNQNQLDQALADLNSAWEIIERCGMNLYAVDYLLIHGRYSLATADYDTALERYEEAKQLIQETGYHLRDAELDILAAMICRQQGAIAGKNSDFYLQKAKNRIEEIGQWGVMRVIERDFSEQ